VCMALMVNRALFVARKYKSSLWVNAAHMFAQIVSA